MLHPSTKKLIDRLAQMTAQQKISWALGDSENSIAYETEGYRVLLEGSPPYLRLTDALGTELETAAPDVLADTPHADGGTYADVIDDLFSEAFRIARGTETAISAVLQGLADTANKTDADALPAEDLLPSPQETVSVTEAPDTVEDVADEAGMPSSGIEPAIPDVGKAVATLADEVNKGAVAPNETKPETPDHSFAPEVPEPTEAATDAVEEIERVETAAPPAIDPPLERPLDPLPPSPPAEEEALPQTSTQSLDIKADPTPPPPETKVDTAQDVQPKRNIGSMGGFGDLSAYRKSTTPAGAVADDAPAPLQKQQPADAPSADIPETPSLDPGPPPAGPVETVRTNSLPPNVRAVLDDVTATPPDGPPQPPQRTVADPPSQGETLSLSGITAGLGLGSIKSAEPVTEQTSTGPERQPTRPSPPPEQPAPQQPPADQQRSDAAEDDEASSEDQSGDTPGSRFNPWM